MTSMAKSQTSLGCYVVRTVLGKAGPLLQREVEGWIEHNGLEWTAKRSKAIWTAALNLRSGRREEAIQIYRENSIAYHKGSCLPKGGFGPAVRGFVHAQKKSTLQRYAAVLRFYTSLKLPGGVTEAQLQKARDSILLPNEKHYGDLDAEAMVAKALSDHHLSCSRLEGLHAGWVPPIPWRYATGLHATSYYYSPVKLNRKVRQDLCNGKDYAGGVPPYYKMALSLCTTAYVPPTLDELVPCQEYRWQLREQIPDWDMGPVGRIQLIQEQGCKGRVVCQPSAWLQMAFRPLHILLSEDCEKIYPRESCLRDHEKGVQAVLELMERGGCPCCTDLSAATDRFPRAFSLELLRRMGLSRYSEALEDVCEHTFIGLDDQEWSYGVGQPMGLYGSFPLFQLSHCVVAELATAEAFRWNREVRVPWIKETRTGTWHPASPIGASMDSGRVTKPIVLFNDGTTFKVIGDDIVFSDSRVADQYRRLMAKIGVQISEEKSYTGGDLVEFAGFICVRKTHGEPATAFRPYKIPAGNTVTNPISFLDNLGALAAAKNSYWREQWEVYQMTRSSRNLDLSPLVASSDDHFGIDTYRGDSATVANCVHVLRMLLGDKVPDTGSSSYEDQHINSMPLFPERWLGDHHGFNPEALALADSRDNRTDIPTVARITRRTIANDPLMREARRERLTEKYPDQRSLMETDGDPDSAKPVNSQRPPIDLTPINGDRTTKPSDRNTGLSAGHGTLSPL